MNSMSGDADMTDEYWSGRELVFGGPFLLEPPRFWWVDWADDIEGTLVHLEVPERVPHRVWRLTGKREHADGVMYYQGVWPD